MDVFELSAKIGLNTSEYENSLTEAGEKTSNFGEKLKSGIATAAKVSATAIGAVTTAVSALTGVVVSQVSNLASYGDNIDKMSQKLGMTAEAYQEWDAVMQHSGTSIESMQTSMKTLASAAETGNKAFDALGLSMDDIALMSQEELFSATITALQNMEDETQRTYLAGQLLGRGATELGALLNTSAEDTQAMKDRVHELGGVMSDDAVKSAAAFQDSLQDMQTAFSGLGRGMLTEFLPSITTVMDGLTALFSGDSEGGIAMINQGVSDFVSYLSESLPQVLSVGTEIVTGLLGAITENLPQLVGAGADAVINLVNGVFENLPKVAESAAEIVGTFTSSIFENGPQVFKSGFDLLEQVVDGILDAIPKMIDALPDVVDGFLGFFDGEMPSFIEKGGTIIIKLAVGIINAIPQLVSKLPQIITSIVNFVANNLPKIVETGVKLTVQLAAGIIQAIPKLVEQLPKIITAIVDGIGTLMSSIIGIGKNIVEGIWKGISAAADWFKEKVSGFFSGIVNGVKKVLGIASPSKVFAEIGGYMAEGLGEGWDDEYSGIKKDIENGLNFGGTATVDFASSGIGKSSAGIINNMQSAPAQQTSPIVLQLVMPDGTKFAEYLFDPFVQYSSAKGTPILRPV